MYSCGADRCRSLVPLDVVGILLENELPIGFLYVVIGNVARHTEDTIIIQARHIDRDYTMPG